MIKKIILWWHDNFKRPSTWSGILFFLFAYSIFNDKEVFHQLLGNIVNDSNFTELIVGAISGGLIAHKQRD